MTSTLEVPYQRLLHAQRQPRAQLRREVRERAVGGRLRAVPTRRCSCRRPTAAAGHAGRVGEGGVRRLAGQAELACVPTTFPAPSNRSERRGQSASISFSSSTHSLARSSRALARVVAAARCRSHQPRPVRTEFGGDQFDELRVGGLGHADRLLQAQLAQDQAGRRGKYAVAAGDLFGELAQRRGVHHAAARRRRPTAATPGTRCPCARRWRRPPRRSPCPRRPRRPAHPRAGRPARRRGRWIPHGCPAPPRPITCLTQPAPSSHVFATRSAM